MRYLSILGDVFNGAFLRLTAPTKFYKLYKTTNVATLKKEAIIKIKKDTVHRGAEKDGKTQLDLLT